jgi:hypothetical protein
MDLAHSQSETITHGRRPSLDPAPEKTRHSTAMPEKVKD